MSGIESKLERVKNNEETQEQIKARRFGELFDQTLQQKGGIPTVEYNLPYRKEDFLRFLVSQKNLVLHGSSDEDRDALEPRQAGDRAKISGNKNAVYAVTDPVLPIFYAIRDRSKFRGLIESGVTSNHETGHLEYTFKMPRDMIDRGPWTRGIVYILDKNDFNPEQDDAGLPSGEWTSASTVVPIAKLEVGPEDFQYLNQVEAI